MKKLKAAVFALSLIACAPVVAVDGDAVLGGAIGGGVGAAVGSEIGGRDGAIVGGAVEASTVDIAKEFTNLIVLQRGYQANTRVVTTVDELSQETINLKR